MKKLVFAITLLLLTNMLFATSLEEQKRYKRFREAIHDKDSTVKAIFENKDLNFPSKDIFLRAFKKQRSLELWARDNADSEYIFVKEYPFTAFSGKLGPKREQGDWQIPEGFYHIEIFNPASSYFLSMGLNYPNQSDKVLAYNSNPGGEIYIHGDKVTIGCIPIGDEGIKELYLIAVYASSNGQNRIPVHIFPFPITDEALDDLKDICSEANYKFWQNIKPGFEYFEKNKKLKSFSIDKETGEYVW